MSSFTESAIEKSRRPKTFFERHGVPNGTFISVGYFDLFNMQREQLRALDTILSEAGQPDPDSPLYSFRKRILAFFRIILGHIIKL